jgi:exodeoxyribonuclease VII large subunit
MLAFRQSRLATNRAKLAAHNPVVLLKQNRQSTLYLSSRLQQATLNLLTHKKSQLSNTARTLHAISPLQTLERGYSISLDSEGTAISSIKQVTRDDKIKTLLADGHIISRVESCKKS